MLSIEVYIKINLMVLHQEVPKGWRQLINILNDSEYRSSLIL